jgi:hypothetical protein
VAIAGAFAYAELGNLMPRVGGQYAYLNAAWHPVVASCTVGPAARHRNRRNCGGGHHLAQYTLQLVGAPQANPCRLPSGRSRSCPSSTSSA